MIKMQVYYRSSNLTAPLAKCESAANPSLADTKSGTSVQQRAVSSATLDTASSRAATASRERVGAIITSKSAAGRGELARYLALETALSADVAIGILDAAARLSRIDGNIPSFNLSSLLPLLPGAEGADAGLIIAVANINAQTAKNSGDLSSVCPAAEGADDAGWNVAVAKINAQTANNSGIAARSFQSKRAAS